MQSSTASSRVLDLFSSPLTLIHLLHPHTSPTLVHLSSHLPVPSSTVTPCVSLSSMSNCISIRPKGCLGSSILSPGFPHIHLHPALARSVSWVALQEISDDLTFQWEQGIMGNRIVWEAHPAPQSLIFIFPSCTDFLLSSVEQGQSHILGNTKHSTKSLRILTCKVSKSPLGIFLIQYSVYNNYWWKIYLKKF